MKNKDRQNLLLLKKYEQSENIKNRIKETKNAMSKKGIDTFLNKNGPEILEGLLLSNKFVHNLIKIVNKRQNLLLLNRL